MEPYLTTKNGALFEADCISFMRLLRPEIFDCIFADPPFNIGKNYNNGFNDRIRQKDYYEWCFEWISEGFRLIKPGGAFFIYALPEIAVYFANHLNQLMEFRHWIALTMKGTYKRGDKLYPAHYALLYYTKGSPRTFNNLRVPVPVCRHCGGDIKDYGGHRNKLNPEGLNLTDFWEDTSPNRHKKFKVRKGVNELKLVIPERAILLSTNEGDLVYDPFGGGGSTFQAAEANHRNWIGTELYDCHHIRSRIDENHPESIGQPPGFKYERLFNDEDSKTCVLRRCERKNLQARPVPSLSRTAGYPN